MSARRCGAYGGDRVLGCGYPLPHARSSACKFARPVRVIVPGSRTGSIRFEWPAPLWRGIVLEPAEFPGRRFRIVEHGVWLRAIVAEEIEPLNVV